eukprot:gene21440-27471_t
MKEELTPPVEAQVEQTADEASDEISQLVDDVEQDAMAERVSETSTPAPAPKSKTPVPELEPVEVEVAVEAEETNEAVVSARGSKPASRTVSRTITPQVEDVEQVTDIVAEKLKSRTASPIVSRIASPAPVSLAPTPGLAPGIAEMDERPQSKAKSRAASIHFAESPDLILSNPSPPALDPNANNDSGEPDENNSFKPINIPTPQTVRSNTTTPVKKMQNKASSPMATPKKVNTGSSPVNIPAAALAVSIPEFLPAPIVKVPLTPLPEVPHVVIKKANIARRRMSATHLQLVTPKKRAKIIKALKKRGLFIHIARQFQEDALRKYANQSLKQRVDCLDAEIRRVYSRIEHLKNAVKKDHVALRELLPIGFHDNYCNLIEMLSVINTNSNGLQVLDNVMKNAMCYDSRTGEPPARLLEMIMNSMRSTVLHEFEMRSASEMNKFKSRLVELSAMIVTKDDLMQMLLPSGKSMSNLSPDKDRPPGTPDINTDPTHAKLVNLINRSIERHQAGLDLANSTKKYATLELSSGASEEQLEEVRNTAQKYTDERIVVMKNAIKQLAYQSDSRVNQFEVDVAQMQEQIMSMQSMHQTSMIAQADNIEMFRKESESLKVLQRKVGNMGIDKLMDDLKHVHQELLQRPSASQVGDMMDLVEHTIKSHLGENIVGLKGLVEQVYKHIQHKVDRDDIKNLISVKLAQMEADLLRREEEAYTMTSTTRCLSCGQRPANPQQAASQGLTKGGNIAPPPATNGIQTTSHIEMTDDISASSAGHRSMMSQSTPMLPSHASSDQIHTLVAGSGGLKPLLVQHSPMKPLHDPYATNTARRRAAGAEKIPEPMYRKAKMAAQMKEMVKITNPSTAMYGYGPSNPLYVMDGMIGSGSAGGGDDMSVQSEMSGQSGMRGNSRMKTNGLHINNIASNTIANTLSNSSSNKNDSRRSSTSEYVTLPNIQSRFPPGMTDSKPNSPDGAASPHLAGQSAKMNTYY